MLENMIKLRRTVANPKYYASLHGQIVSMASGKLRVLRQNGHSSPGGYMAVSFKVHGRVNPRLVHRVVAETWFGRCPKGKICRHLNGDPRDNRVVNLRWGTMQENIQDRKRHGTLAHGEGHYNARLTDCQVREIKCLCVMGALQKEVANLFGVSRGVVSLIVRGEAWTHLNLGKPIRGQDSSRNPSSKFTPEEVREIRRRYTTGETQMSIARSYGVCGPTISEIVNRKSYRDIS